MSAELEKSLAIIAAMPSKPNPTCNAGLQVADREAEIADMLKAAYLRGYEDATRTAIGALQAVANERGKG